MLPIPADLPGPANPDTLVPTRYGDGHVELRPGVGLIIWPEEWWAVRPGQRPKPLALLHETAPIETAEVWMDGRRKGHEEGFAGGEAYGRRVTADGFQAGLRVLAGVGQPGDAGAFSNFVRVMGGDRR